MPNLQPIIDNAHLIIAGFALLVWAWAQLVQFKAKAAETNWWDSQVSRAQWALSAIQQSIDWLDKAGAGKWKGSEKLTESIVRVKRFEALWAEGKIVEAIAEIAGFRQAAYDKLASKADRAAPPFAPIPAPPTTPSLPPALGDGNLLSSPRAADGPDSSTALDTAPAVNPEDGR
jgi:hypothetical protein